MVSVKNEINEVLLNAVSDLENRLDESRNVLSDIQEKMDSKVSEAKEYKVQVDDAKENISRLEEEIKSLENDLVELKDKYGKKNLMAVIDAGTREINAEIKKKQDEIQIHKNKIAELTNRARSIKDLLMNLKKDKKIKEERLKDLENCTNYYKVRLTEVVKFAEEHDDLDDYFVSFEDEPIKENINVFEDIVGSVEEEKIDSQIEVSIEEADEVFNEVINPTEEDESDSSSLTFENIVEVDNNEIDHEINDEPISDDEKVVLDEEASEKEEKEDEYDDADIRSLEINDLLSSVKEPIIEIEAEENEETKEIDKLSKLNQAIDEEFVNIFGTDINEPLKSGELNIQADDNNENDIVNELTNIGIDYYSFTEEDRKLIKDKFNGLTIKNIVEILNDNKIQLDNLYLNANVLFDIAPAELSNIISKLLASGQSADAIGYVLDKLSMIDIKLLDSTINNYGEYIKNVDIADIIVKSLKGVN